MRLLQGSYYGQLATNKTTFSSLDHSDAELTGVDKVNLLEVNKPLVLNNWVISTDVTLSYSAVVNRCGIGIVGARGSMKGSTTTTCSADSAGCIVVGAGCLYFLSTGSGVGTDGKECILDFFQCGWRVRRWHL